jgi:HlyD family secretion protein
MINNAVTPADPPAAGARAWLGTALAAALGGAALAATLAGCEPKPAHPGQYQGVIELDERVLGFELGGRVTRLAVARGAQIEAGAVLATLDDTLERTAREAREAEASSARAQASLVRAGSRPEEISAMSAQLRAQRATEGLIEKNLERGRALFAAGAVTQASVDELESRHQAAVAERQAVEHRLRELRAGARRQEVQGADARVVAAETATRLEAERVGRYQLRALEGGEVLDTHVEPGEIVGAGAPVLTVADTAHPYAEVFVPEGELQGVRVGAHALLTVDGEPQPFPATVERVSRKTEFTPRYLFSDRERPNLVVRVRVRVDDPERRLHAGVPAFVAITRQGADAGAP